MHPTSITKMRAFAAEYLSKYNNQTLEILDVGSQCIDVQESYRPIFTRPGWRYRGLDMTQGPNVDIKVADPYRWDEVADCSIDVVVSGQALEHIEFPWRTIEEINKVLRPGGLACLIAPSAGQEHRYPADCWRIYPDGMSALAKSVGLVTVELFADWGLGPWQDTFAVLQKPFQPGEMTSFPLQLDLQVALEAYRAALVTRPRSPSYYTTLSELTTVDDEAALILRVGLEACAGSPDLRRRLIAVLLRSGRFHAALEHTIQLLPARPMSVGNLQAIAAVANVCNDEDRELLSALLPNENVVSLARAASSNGQWALAALAWKEVGRRSRKVPDDVDVQYALALHGCGRIDDARSAFDVARQRRVKRVVVDRTSVIQRLINAYNYNSYLEIGVARGENFLQIKAPIKIGVDPNFRIPGISHCEVEQFFAMESDEFFANPPQVLLEHGVDVAFVDGLHTSGQALRDIENCLRYLNVGGTVVVHDCLPATPSEAAPTFDLARSIPGFDGNWTGDVFRAIAELRASRSDLWIAVLDVDHGVGIIRSGTPEDRVRLTKTEASQLSYERLSAERTTILNLKTAVWFDDWLGELSRHSD
ncbi:class I SAM-dependent methyltransferase [Faunimonas sp. B44]|uniref:class I SAM-dependent methyltransferase n=1 Tax=Faunimonas sp. B44 TaxID=3461493 RepID=UPI004044CC99